jgi:hypothetical protein
VHIETCHDDSQSRKKALRNAAAVEPSRETSRKLRIAQVSVLDRLEANLRAEQRSLAELDFLLFTQLLTPIQARRKCHR